MGSALLNASVSGHMAIAPWISLLTILIVPLLATSQTGRTWFVCDKYRGYVWGFLGSLAVLGLAAALTLFRDRVRIGTLVLVATPLLQAVTFVLADKLFRLLVGRAPVAFDEARFGRRADGGRYWRDSSFWFLVFLGLTIGAAFLCESFGIDFPTRWRR